MFYEVVTSDCPTGFDFDSLVLTAPYEGPKMKKEPPAVRRAISGALSAFP